MKGFLFFIILTNQSPEERADLYIKLADYKNAVMEYSDLIFKKPEDKKLREKLLFSANKYIEKNFLKMDKEILEKALSKYRNGELDSALYLSKILYDKFYFEPEVVTFYQRCLWTVDTLRKLYSLLIDTERKKDYQAAHRYALEIKNIYPSYPEIDEKINYYFSKIPKVEEKRPLVVERREVVKKPVEKPVEAEKAIKVEEDVQAKVQELYKRGVTLYSEGKLEEAREIFREILKIDPQNTKVRRNLAVIEERLRGRR
ncbi:MAG: tetratricopeptide repeat protein [candidate division WOR-3 bacterium]